MPRLPLGRVASAGFVAASMIVPLGVAVPAAGAAAASTASAAAPAAVVRLPADATPAPPAPPAPGRPGPAAPSVVPNPAVTAIPTTAQSTPFLSDTDLRRHGYVEEEFSFSGKADIYAIPTLADATVATPDIPYTSRLIVRRPTDPRRFNGVVVVEWLNVSAGYDIEAAWLPHREHFLREGYAWVGVSAQTGGVNHLRAWNPDRYGSLDTTAGGTVTPADALSYDIFSQAVQALRSPKQVWPLGALTARHVMAVGASQSAGRLAVYHNAIHPLHTVIDSLLLTVGGGQLRTDVGLKVLQVLSETDVRAPSTTPDSATFRRWEVAGTSHFDENIHTALDRLLERDYPEGLTEPACTSPPFSRAPLHHVTNAAIDHLARWARFGAAPPSAPGLTFTTGPDGRQVLARDERGIALGGIRLAAVDVPTAVNTGVNGGESFCILYGTHVPFDEATLNQLYRSHADYVGKVTAATARNVARGYVVRADATATITEARRSDIP
ncbi:alpha/beta hydrolase domain-containing protein [Parafrankia elaeagni]|uniref:alpha/beta hydrolase domain-containing protein n=1 Tax=Parafrankia elaeagni TaxID=222534 RepID=UPI00036C8AB6|nr:alpha/beta hydrolase domain-containing protein [Parafrankia elaeagni]